MIVKMKISMKETFKGLFWIIFGSLAMLAALFALKIFIDPVSDSKSRSIIMTALFTGVGIIVYFIFTYKQLFKQVVGKELISKFGKIFKRGGKSEIKEQ